MPPTRTQPPDRLNHIAWDTYARQRLPTEQPCSEPPSLWWTPWPGTGPGADILDPLTGPHVLELGCGAGDNAAALATAAATVTAIDASPAMVRRARLRWAHIPRLHHVCADATAHLTRPDTETYDLVCSIFGALTFTPPHQILPLIATRLRPGGQLALSTRLPAADQTAHTEPALLTLPNGHHASLVRYPLTASQWDALLHRHGFNTTRTIEINHPHRPDATGCLIIIATLDGLSPSTAVSR